MDGRNTKEAALFITLSLFLTFTVFAVNLYGMRHVVPSVVRASAKIRASVARASASVTSVVHKIGRSSIGAELSPTCMGGSPPDMHGKERQSVVTCRASAKGEATGGDLDVALTSDDPEQLEGAGGMEKDTQCDSVKAD